MKMRAASRRSECYWRKESGVKQQRLLRGGDFLNDGLRRRSRIGCRKNRPANHEEIGAGANCFSRRCGARLIVRFGARRFLRWAHARSDDEEITAASLANRLGFLH